MYMVCRRVCLFLRCKGSAFSPFRGDTFLSLITNNHSTCISRSFFVRLTTRNQLLATRNHSFFLSDIG